MTEKLKPREKIILTASTLAVLAAMIVAHFGENPQKSKGSEALESPIPVLDLKLGPVTVIELEEPVEMSIDQSEGVIFEGTKKE